MLFSWVRLNRYKAAVIIILAVSFLIALGLLYIPLDRRDVMPRAVTIPSGTGVYGIAKILYDGNLIRSKTLFVIYALALGQESHLKAGRYIFSPAMNTPDMVWKIAGGYAEPDDVAVLIPEGYNVWEIDARLAYMGLIKEGEFASRYYGQEGHFFPDTYRFKKGSSVEAIAQKMEENFIKKAGYVSKDVLIIASLLEKEARKKNDMELVASVIDNRLKKGMYLQIDATVIYGACLKRYIYAKSWRNCDVTEMPVATELALDGDFNSYRRPGLPPQPIANPGPRALEAARNHPPSDFYFYLSTRDGSKMIFARTGVEHVTNRAKYLGL